MSHDRPGRFVRRDLMSTDPAGAQRFYAELFGWRCEPVEVPGMGGITQVLAGDLRLGAILPLDPAHGMPSHWMSYVTVADIDAACPRATKLGGSVCYAPFDLPLGRTAILEDPGGAVFHVLQARAPTPDLTGLPPLHTFSWSVLRAGDARAAQPFYAGLFDWSFAPTPDGHAWMATCAGADFPHCSFNPRDGDEGRDDWLPYVVVEDAAATLERAVAAGAQRLQGREPVGDFGWSARLRDPGGAELALWERRSS